MKKQVIAALVLVAAAIGATTPSWAFQSTQIATVTAGTFVGGARTASFRLSVRSINNQLVNLPVAQSSITWSNINSGQGWTMADRLLVLNSTVTDNNGGIQIYTENTIVDPGVTSAKFVDPTPATAAHPEFGTNPDSNAAGLLDGLSGTTNKAPLPVAWTIKDATRTIESGTSATGVGATDPNTGSGSGFNNKFQWLLVADSFNTGGIDYNQNGVIVLPNGSIDPGDAAPFVDGAIYQSMIRKTGLHTQQDPGSFEGIDNGSDAFVYFEANFQKAAAQTFYQTTTLRIEAFIQ